MLLAAQAQKQTAVRLKKRFHHGDLREALIAATRELLSEVMGPDGFTLADSFRRVEAIYGRASTSISRDKQERDPGGERGACVRGDERSQCEGAQGDKGLAAPLKVSRRWAFPYLEYAIAQPAIFGLMFGELKKASK